MAWSDWLKSDCERRAEAAGYSAPAAYLHDQCLRFCKHTRDPASRTGANFTGGMCVTGTFETWFGCKCDCKCSGESIHVFEDQELVL
jgi:hypothetical protein